MKKKFSIVLLFSVSLIFLFSFVFSSSNVSAFSTNNNKDFSRFVNINKPGGSTNEITYTEEITIQTINKTNEYQIATELQPIYGEFCEVSSDMNYKNKNNYGFKVNGEFFTESYTINESGTYFIQIYFYTISNNISIISSNELESFTINVDLELKLEMTKKVFYYEHYGYNNDLIEDVQNSLNTTEILSSISTSRLNELFNSYLSKRKDNSNYSGEELETVVVISFNNFSEKFSIKMKSIRSKDIEPIDPNVLFSKNFDLIIDTSRYYSYIGQNLKEIPDIKEEIINLKLNVPEGHLLEKTYECEIIMPSINKSGISSDFIISYLIEDVGTGEIYNFNRKVYFYNSNLNSDNEKPVLEYSTDLKIKQNDSDFNFFVLVEDVYDVLIFGEKEFHSHLDVKNLNIDSSKVNFYKPGVYDIIFSCSDYSNNTKIDTIQVEITDGSSPKVLTKYNKIYINKKTKSFIDQIKIIDNYKVDDSKTTYEFIEEDKNGGYIIVHAEDFNNNVTDKMINFTYEKDLSFFEKHFILPFYRIKKFITGIFQ